MKKNMMVFWICLLLGILSVIYAVMVHATGSGTAFFLIWIGIGIVVFLFGISVYMEVWKKVPHPVKIFAGMVVCIGLLVFCIVEGCVISQMHEDGREGLDYIIVLGAQVRKDGPSPVLKYRLDKAVEYLNENPDTVCIVSGGQGSNEPWSEAEGMARYLQEKGFDYIQKKELELTQRAMEGLGALPYVHILGSKDPANHTGIVSFTIDGVHPHDVSEILSSDGIDVRAGHHCAQPLLEYLGVRSSTRASMMFYNTPEEIDALIESVSTIRRRMGYGE